MTVRNPIALIITQVRLSKPRAVAILLQNVWQKLKLIQRLFSVLFSSTKAECKCKINVVLLIHSCHLLVYLDKLMPFKVLQYGPIWSTDFTATRFGFNSKNVYCAVMYFVLAIWFAWNVNLSSLFLWMLTDLFSILEVNTFISCFQHQQIILLAYEPER